MRLLKKIDIEFYLILFLFSGMLKDLFFSIFGNNFIKLPLTILFGLLFIIMIYSKNQYELIRLKSFFKKYIFFILFFLWGCFSIIYSSSENYVWYKLLGLGTNYLVFFGVLIIKKIDLELFTKYFSYFLLLFILIFFLVNPNSLSKSYFFTNYFNEEFIQGWYLTLGQLLIVFMILIFSLKNKKLRIHLLLISFNIIILLGGRFPLLLSIITLTIIVTFLFRNNKEKIKLLSKFTKSLIVLLSINFLFFLFSGTYKELIQRSIFRFEVLSSTKQDISNIKNEEIVKSSPNKNASFINRFKYLDFSIKKIFKNEKTILIGHGLGSFSYEYNKEDKRLYPHNIILEIAFELGFIGLIIICFFIYSNRDVFNGFLYNLPLLACIVLFINSMKSSSIIDLRLLFALYAISIFHNKIVKKSNV